MESNEYQVLAERTLIDRPDFEITDEQVMLVWNAMGLAGEAGEIAELAKKQIFHQQGVDVEKWKNELGDVLWYLSAICSKLGLKLGDVMEQNVQKLQARFPDGWDPSRSHDRFKRGRAK
jgi:NTP pyrophosphatase (non-canonical NTP hydrolase)